MVGAHSISLQAFISGAYVNGNSSSNVRAGYKRCKRINEERGLISAGRFDESIVLAQIFFHAKMRMVNRKRYSAWMFSIGK